MPWIGGAALAGCAVFFSGEMRDVLLVALMLFLPFLDKQWREPALQLSRWHMVAWGACLLLAGGLASAHPAYIGVAISGLLFAAIPEEWFFRAYFMSRLGGGWQANLLTSLLFSLLHGLTQDWLTAVLVFWPSLAFGLLYQYTKDLPLVVLVHAISNLLYILWIEAWLRAWVVM